MKSINSLLLVAIKKRNRYNLTEFIGYQFIKNSMLKTLFLPFLLMIFINPALAKNDISILKNQSELCVASNSLPDHEIGKFPNRANPHSIREHLVKFCVPVDPVKNKVPKFVKGTIGIAINGIQFRPNTAGFYDPMAKSGHSRNGDKRWSLDIFGAKNKLGLDQNNGHIGPNGLYHYHGIAKSLVITSGNSLIGYAGDGFEIHYLGDKVKSGYELKSGIRPSGPGGKYDGSYNEDFIHKALEGALDECNGGKLSGKFVYFITNTYPFIGRCLWGDISPGFGVNRH